MNKTQHTFKYCLIVDGKSDGYRLIPQDHTFLTWQNNLNTYSNSARIDPLVFKNKGFQSLVEAMVIYFPEIGISDYEPAQEEDYQFGISGFGKRDGCVVSICTKVSDQEELTDGNSEITEFFVQSSYRTDKGFNYLDDKKIFAIFTNAKKIHENTKLNFISQIGEEKISFFGVDEIKEKLDGNKGFWDFLKSSYETAYSERLKSDYDFKKLDVFQQETLDKILSKKAGRYQVLDGTGSGKGEIVIEQILEDVDRKIRNDPNDPSPMAKSIEFKWPMVLCASPTINLAHQSIERLQNRMVQYETGFEYAGWTLVSFNSGKYFNKDHDKKCSNVPNVINVSSKKELKRICLNSNGPVVIFTTYHSSHKVVEAKLPFILAIGDESHNIVKGRSIPRKSRRAIISKEFYELCKMIVFYTATPIYSKINTKNGESIVGNGMENKELFGEVISVKTPKFLIENGKIVRPFLCSIHVTYEDIVRHTGVKNPSQDEIVANDELNAYIVIKMFTEAELMNEKYSKNPSLNRTQMLVRCGRSDFYTNFFRTKTYLEFHEKNPDVHFYGISSGRGVWLNGKNEPSNSKNKSLFLGIMARPETSEKRIIFHINMIGEGWNVPGINAVLLFGEAGDITLSQTLGRGGRLSSFDRRRLENGTLHPSDCVIGEFVKPFCYVGVVTYECEYSDLKNNNAAAMIKQVQNNLDYYPSENYIDSNIIGPHIIRTEQESKEKTFEMPEVDVKIESHIEDIVASIEKDKKFFEEALKEKEREELFFKRMEKDLNKASKKRKKN